MTETTPEKSQHSDWAEFYFDQSACFDFYEEEHYPRKLVFAGIGARRIRGWWTGDSGGKDRAPGGRGG